MKNYIYILAPVIATIIFAFYHNQFVKESRIKAAEKARIEAQLAAEEKAKRDAYILEQERKAKEEAERKERLRKEKAELIRQQVEKIKILTSELDKANIERDDKSIKYQDLRNEKLDLEDAIARAEERLKALSSENEFLKKYLPQSQANVNSMRAWLREVEDWVKNQERLKKEAASAAAKASR